MSGVPTGAQPGAGTPTDQPGVTTPAAPPAAPAPPPGAGTAPARTYTQEEFDGATAAARKRAEGEARAAAKTAGELQAERDALLAERTTREQAEMTELQRLQAAAEASAAAAAQAQAQAEVDRRERLRLEAITEHGQGLPKAYHSLVVGDDAETLAAKAGEAQAALLADQQAFVAALAAATPEQLDQYGDAGKALAARLRGQPASIGAPSAAPSQPGPPLEAGKYDPGLGLDAYRALAKLRAATHGA